ncbi:DUF2934 domain-containing protein [Variovorax sp. J22P271]|uniref:DUF2934 domain-containing protein n=1 Tax=Variovorax davisae TaxID=3053515 RepID=UPI00257734AD|nr:DUF2934 domain-containing protein [Variovorax sp. J22P271]MDM0032228.1 DUF2934 domain-containing protein [Variovorax sp. J22P271]
MNTRNQQDSQASDPERGAVKRNMEKATEKEPAEFRDQANENKVVEIGQELTHNPIQGIDPKAGTPEPSKAGQQADEAEDEEQRQTRIREAAHAAWERRGGLPPGSELDDWLDAERSLFPQPGKAGLE